MKRLLLAVAWLDAFASLALCQSPITVDWNTRKSFGPDGPWQAVEIGVGSSTVNLYPGGWFETDVVSSSICNAQDNCPAAEAGLYSLASNTPAIPPGSMVQPGFFDQWNAGPETNLTGSGSFMFESLSIPTSNSTTYHIPDVSYSLIESASIMLPNETQYQSALGYLALGASMEQSGQYELKNGSKAVANLMIGYLQNTSQIPSSSFGLQIGSVAQAQQGSLILGGYDQSRLLGPVGVFHLGGVGGGEPVANMTNVTLSVETGPSPFNSTNIGSLFQLGSTQNTSVTVSFNPTVPYMQLPVAMCDAVAAYLPVTFDSSLGLYLWNTSDPQFAMLVNSPAYVAFTFPQQFGDDLVVKVPFSVLNLTLENPIVGTPTQYFPCKPYNSLDGRYFLGRAFLQAAYLATNWDQMQFFVAQAAGPASGEPVIMPINPTDDQIYSSPGGSFAASWSAKWTATVPANFASADSSSGSSSSSSSAPGLSPSAKAFVSSFVVVFVLSAAGFTTWICLLRRRKQAAARHRAAQLQGQHNYPSAYYYKGDASNGYHNGYGGGSGGGSGSSRGSSSTHSWGATDKPLPPVVQAGLHEAYSHVPPPQELDGSGSVLRPMQPLEADSREVGDIPLMRGATGTLDRMWNWGDAGAGAGKRGGVGGKGGG